MKQLAFDIAPQKEIKHLSSTVATDEITDEISKVFDYAFDGTVSLDVEIPKLPKDFEIGLIYGSSGSGKSTIANALGGEEKIEWDNSKSIASHFDSYEDACNLFGAVGLNSIPTWVKPYNALSNGERFRADMARRLKSGAIIDEFTSVVNREVAISCSCSISKYIRKVGMKNVIFLSCHEDIIPYLQPNWVYNTDTKELITRGLPQRPTVELKIFPCKASAWELFKNHHYLSGDLNKASTCYIATINDTPVAFVSLLTLPGRDVKHAWREHRVVVLPDFQGMGIGNKLSEAMGEIYTSKGYRYFAKTSNPRMGVHRDNSPLWRGTVNNHKSRESYFDKNGNVRANMKYTMRKEMVAYHARRVCYSHEYMGNGNRKQEVKETDNQLTWSFIETQKGGG